jgi:hypothetical protein
MGLQLDRQIHVRAGAIPQRHNTVTSKQKQSINEYSITQSINKSNLSIRGCAFVVRNTEMRGISTFRSTTDRIYDGGPIRLYYNIIIPLCYNCL